MSPHIQRTVLEQIDVLGTNYTTVMNLGRHTAGTEHRGDTNIRAVEVSLRTNGWRCYANLRRCSRASGKSRRDSQDSRRCDSRRT